jgi:hypothetical protein
MHKEVDNYGRIFKLLQTENGLQENIQHSATKHHQIYIPKVGELFLSFLSLKMVY